MKSSLRLFLLGAALAGISSAPAAVFIYHSQVGQNIPDGSTSGLVNTITVPENATVNLVSVVLNLIVPAGEIGYLGDLYGYLQHGTSQSILLNRPGRGAVGSAGYNDNVPVSVTFNDTAVNGDIHNYRLALNGDHLIPLSAPLTGSWQPDGRAIDPDLVQLSDPRSALLGTFVGSNSSDGWSLFLADLSGGGTYQIDNWTLTLDLTIVPEPQLLAAASAALLLAFAIARKLRRTSRRI